MRWGEEKEDADDDEKADPINYDTFFVFVWCGGSETRKNWLSCCCQTGAEIVSL